MITIGIWHNVCAFFNDIKIKVSAFVFFYLELDHSLLFCSIMFRTDIFCCCYRMLVGRSPDWLIITDYMQGFRQDKILQNNHRKSISNKLRKAKNLIITKRQLSLFIFFFFFLVFNYHHPCLKYYLPGVRIAEKWKKLLAFVTRFVLFSNKKTY